MSLTNPSLNLLEAGFRWFGPSDPVPLDYIRQAGATAVYTSLHQIPYGEVCLLLDEQDRRPAAGQADWRISFRPDHGHTIMDGLGKPPGVTPGYPCIGRMRGLAELRGLMLGLRHAQNQITAQRRQLQPCCWHYT